MIIKMMEGDDAMIMMIDGCGDDYLI